jgi:hypothetical protein
VMLPIDWLEWLGVRYCEVQVSGRFNSSKATEESLDAQDPQKF